MNGNKISIPDASAFFQRWFERKVFALKMELKSIQETGFVEKKLVFGLRDKPAGKNAGG
jgi:hypothetical protein